MESIDELERAGESPQGTRIGNSDRVLTSTEGPIYTTSWDTTQDRGVDLTKEPKSEKEKPP